MRGIELPVNVLVIIAVAVIVLLGLIGLYMAGILAAVPIPLAGAKAAACDELVRLGQCKNADAPFEIVITNFDADMDGTLDGGSSTSAQGLGKDAKDNLGTLCMAHYKCAWPEKEFITCCHKRQCGCP
jgi:hypothetical protein